MGNADVRKNSTDNFNDLADKLVAGIENAKQTKSMFCCDSETWISFDSTKTKIPGGTCDTDLHECLFASK